MIASELIVAVGSVGVFQARAFMPAFVAALLLRAPDRVPFFTETLTRIAAGTPAWFTHDVTIVALGVLTILEFAANRSEDAREILNMVSHYAKAAAAAVVSMGLLNDGDARIINTMSGAEAGVGQVLLPFLVAVGTLHAAKMRTRIDIALWNSDPDDSMGMKRLLNWLDDFWGCTGMVMLIVAPVVVFLVVGIIFFTLSRVQKLMRKREEQARVPCAKCNVAIYLSATSCPACRSPVAQPHAVGFFGQSIGRPVEDTEAHKLTLLEKNRCPVCATHLTGKAPGEACEACGYEIFKSPGDQESYLAMIAGRLPVTLILCGLLSLVPVFGAIPGIVLYRFRVVTPFARYLSRGRRILTRWSVRIAVFLLLTVQWVPVVGGLSVPLMALISYSSYRKAFRKALPAQAFLSTHP